MVMSRPTMRTSTSPTRSPRSSRIWRSILRFRAASAAGSVLGSTLIVAGSAGPLDGDKGAGRRRPRMPGGRRMAGGDGDRVGGATGLGVGAVALDGPGTMGDDSGIDSRLRAPRSVDGGADGSGERFVDSTIGGADGPTRGGES